MTESVKRLKIVKDSTQKKKVPRISIEVSEELYTEYKIHCVKERKGLSEHGKEIIEEHLRSSSKNGKD